MTSTSNGNCGASAPGPVTHWREPFDELKRSCQDFHVLLERLLESSSEGCPVEHVSPSPDSDSQAF